MDIVFEHAVTLSSDEAIYLDLPPKTEVAHINDDCGRYSQLWRGRRDARVALQLFTLGRNAGTYWRGPRVQSVDQS
jgi:hypothetical protein